MAHPTASACSLLHLAHGADRDRRVRDRAARAGSDGGDEPDARPHPRRIARRSGATNRANRILERAKQVRVFLELGKLPPPAANELDVQSDALSADDPGHVHEVLRARGHQLVDDEVFRRAGSNDDAGRDVPGRRRLDGVDLRRNSYAATSCSCT
jgi:hypothetical protein